MSESKPLHRRRWPRRLAWTLLIGAVAIRFGGVALLPTLIDRFVEPLGLALRYERLDLSLFGGSLELGHLELRSRSDEAALLTLESLQVDAEMSALFIGELRVRRVEVDGVQAKLARRADGSIGLDGWSPPPGDAREPESQRAAPDAGRAPAPSATTKTAFDFTPPCEVELLRVQNVRVLFRDETVTPELLTPASIELHVSDIGHPSRATTVDLSVRAPGVVDRVSFALRARLGVGEGDLQCALGVQGVAAELVRRYAPRAGIDAVARTLDFELGARAGVRPLDPTAEALGGRFELTWCAAIVDGKEELTLQAQAELLEWTRDGAHLGTVTSALGGRAARRADGVLQALGFAFARGEPGEVAVAPPPSLPSSPPSQPPASPHAAGDERPFRLRIDEIRPSLRLALRDEALLPPRDLVVELADSALRGFDTEASATAEPTTLQLHLTAPDVVCTVRGEVRSEVAAPRGSLEFEIALGDGLSQLKPYLAMAGIEPTFERGTLTGSIRGSAVTSATGASEVSVAIGPLRFVTSAAGGDAGAPLEVLALDRLQLDQLRIGPAAGELALRSLELGGVRATARREVSGAWNAAGWRIVATPGQAPVEPVELALEEVTVRLSDVAIDADATLEPKAAALDLTVKVRDLCELLHVQGRVALRPAPLMAAAQLRLDASGLRGGPLTSLLRERGIEPELRAGTLSCGIDVAVRDDGAVRRASLHVEPLRLLDGEEELVALTALRVGDVVQRPGRLVCGPIEIVEPRASVRRDEAGTLHAAGFAFARPPVAAAAPAPSAAHAASETTVGPDRAPATIEPALAFELAGLKLSGARLRFDDAAVVPAVATNATVDVTVGGLVLGSASPTHFEIVARVANSLDELALRGDFTTDPLDLGMRATVSANGVRAGPLAAYAPTDVALLTKDGRLAFSWSARLRADASGSRRAEFSLRELAWRDGEAPPLLALDELVAVVPQLDLPYGPLVIEQVTSRGLVLRGQRVDDETIELLGLRVRSSAPSAAGADVGAATAATAPIAAPSASRFEPTLPSIVRLGVIDLGVAEFRFSDARHADAPPLIASFSLRHREPSVVWSEEAAQIEPLRFEVVASALPVLRELAIALEATPFAPTPELTLIVDAVGGSGPGLLAVVPQLAEQLELSALTDATFHARLVASAQVKRRGAAAIDLGAGFGGELSLSDVALRATPDGGPIVALERVEVDVAKVRPATGAVHVRSIEVRKPVAAVRQTAETIELGPIHWRRPAVAPVVATSEADAVASESGAASESTEMAAPARPEIRIDELLVTGLDFTLLDESVAPPLRLPLTDLEVEVRRFTTRAFTEPRPIPFRVGVTAGTVELKKRDAGTLLGGFLRAAAGAVVGSAAEVEVEPRAAWEELVLQGSVALFPGPTGFVQLDVRALELQAFKGAAAASGVEIGDGLLDTNVRVQLRGAKGMVLDSDTTLTSLSVTEPPNGPIATYLKLPAPLDSILFLLRNEDDETRLPVRFEVAGDGMSGGEIARVATTTLLRLIADAVAAAPMRVASGALDAVQLKNLPGLSSVPGLGSLLGNAEPLPFDGTPVVLSLEAGAAALPADALTALAPILAQLRADPSLSVVVEHQFGGADFERMRRWSQPQDDDLADLARKLRARRDVLGAQREAAASAARLAFGTNRSGDGAGGAQARTAQERLRELEQELARTEAALDATLALHGDSRRGAAQRVRAGAQALATTRLASARDLLMGAAVEAIGTRLDVKRPRVTPPVGSDGGFLIVTPRQKRGAK